MPNKSVSSIEDTKISKIANQLPNGSKVAEMESMLSGQMQKLWRAVEAAAQSKNYGKLNQAMNAVSTALSAIYGFSSAAGAQKNLVVVGADEAPVATMPSTPPAPTDADRLSNVPIAGTAKHISHHLDRILETWNTLMWHANNLGPDYEPLRMDLEKAHAATQIAAAGAKHLTSEAGMLLERLQKAAAELDLVDSEDARQAIEGLDAVLIGCANDGVVADAAVLDRLMRTAGFLDSNYKHGAADLLDKIAISAEFPHAMPRGESREEMYDANEHNINSMWEIVKHEIAENRKEDNVETHRGSADSLSTRYDPELPGVQVYHVADGSYQSMATHKIYDYTHGYTRTDGEKNPGGSVANQTPRLVQYAPVNRMFDTRLEISKRKS